MKISSDRQKNQQKIKKQRKQFGSFFLIKTSVWESSGIVGCSLIDIRKAKFKSEIQSESPYLDQDVCSRPKHQVCIKSKNSGIPNRIIKILNQYTMIAFVNFTDSVDWMRVKASRIEAFILIKKNLKHWNRSLMLFCIHLILCKILIKF